MRPVFAKDYTLPKPKFKIVRDAGTLKNAVKLFEYWSKIPESKHELIRVRVYRLWPLIDMKKIDPKAQKYEREWIGAIPFRPEECYDAFLKEFGSGEWRVDLYEANIDGPIMQASFSSIDRDNFPPKVDYRTIIHGPFANKDYIQWLERQPGLDLPWTKTPEQEQEKNDMNVAGVLVDVLNKQNERLEQKAEKLEEKVEALQQAEEEDEDAAEEEEVQSVSSTVLATGLRMIEKQVDRITTESAKSYDPIAVAKSVIDMTQQMRGNSDTGMMPLLMEMMKQQVASAEKHTETMREEAKFWREKAMATPVQNGGEPPKLTDQLEQLTTFKALARELFGRDRAPEREPVPEKPGLLESLVQNPAFLNVLNNGFMLLVQALAPKTAADPNALRTALNGQPPPQQAQAGPQPVEMTEQQRAQQMTMQFFKLIEKPFLAHFFDTEQQGLDGYTFGHAMHCEFVHGGIPTQNGRAQYVMIRDQWGLRFDQLIRQYPPMWEMLQGNVPKYTKFLEEFFNYDQELARRELEETPPAAVAH